MSLGPTATSVMQAYGQPCAFSTEQEVRAKTARRVAPTALEVNSEGVIQLDGVATRGLFMPGGPIAPERTVTITANDQVNVTLGPEQLIDGVLICENGSGATTVTLPSVTSINAFLNSNLISSAPAITVGPGVVNAPRPRTMFKLTVFTNAQVDFVVPGVAAPGHALTGYQRLANPLNNGDMSLTTPALGATLGSVLVLQPAAAAMPRLVQDIYFIQTLGAGTDPEWLIMTN